MLRQFSNCLTTITYSNILSNETGPSSVCKWIEQKRQIDRSIRWEELLQLFREYRERVNQFDCLVLASERMNGFKYTYKESNHLLIPLCLTKSLVGGWL